MGGILMRVLLADDHAIVRQGLHALLEKKAGVKVIAQAEDGRDAVRLAEQHRPDLVIMDIAMPGLNGLEALLQLKMLESAPKVIILSMHVEENYVTRALRSGASGYVYKGSAFDDLELAMKSVSKNEVFLSPAVSQVLVNGYLNIKENEDTDNKLDILTSREREVLQLLAEKKSRTQIADILMISVKTVDRHRENIKLKLQLKHEDELCDFARDYGLTDIL
jgi:DNA-binding NarL/FixJ family response regulator